MRSPARSPLLLVALFALLAVTWVGSSAAGAVDTAQRVATLLTAHEAFAGPTARSAPLGRIAAQRPITGERTILPVLATRSDAQGQRWLRVRLPGRPNGHTGWIRRRQAVVSTTRWHIVVALKARRVTAYLSGRRVQTFSAVVGKASTPTPTGQFFVEEAIELQPSDMGAPYAFALSARSNVLQEFDGGPGQIGIHGLANIGGVPGTAVSHGCIRLANDAMRWLVVRIGPGVPVTISQ